MDDVTARGGRQHIPRPDDAQPGDPAPWSGRSAQELHFTAADVRASSRSWSPTVPAPAEELRLAAVLVPLFEDDGELRVILTKRPDSMPWHQGEIAFPGGRHDPALDADLQATALREANEEIGLDPAAVEIVGELDTHTIPRTTFSVHPFVGLLAGRPVLEPHPDEVAAVFDVACADLLGEAVYRQELWGNRDRPVHFYELPSETVWGATARILTELFDRLITRPKGSGLQP